MEIPLNRFEIFMLGFILGLLLTSFIFVEMTGYKIW